MPSYARSALLREALRTAVATEGAAALWSRTAELRAQDALAQRTTVGEFATVLTAMLLLFAPLRHLTEMNTPLHRGVAAAECVFGLIY